MEYIQLLLLLLVFITIVGNWMKVANYIGEKLKIGKFFINLCKSTRRQNK